MKTSEVLVLVTASSGVFAAALNFSKAVIDAYLSKKM
jgi:hypothetical protein